MLDLLSISWGIMGLIRPFKRKITWSFVFLSEFYFPFTFTSIPWNQCCLEIVPTTIMLLSQKLWSLPSPHPGPCIPPFLLTAPAGFSKTEKIQNTLFEAKWPQEKIRAHITESDKEYSLFRPLSHIRIHIWEELPSIKLKKHTTSFLWFLYPISDRPGQILLILL